MSSESLDIQAAKRPRRRFIGWFTVGFILVFVAMALLCQKKFYNGEVVTRTKLWRYYILQVQQASHTTGATGPTSANAGHAVETLVMHVLISFIGGGVGLGVGWFVCNRRDNGQLK